MAASDGVESGKAASDGVESGVHEFLKSYGAHVEGWTAAVLPVENRKAPSPSALLPKQVVLGALYQAPGELTPALPRLAEDLRTWQEAVEALAPSQQEEAAPALRRLATVATATARELQQRINRLRILSIALAPLIVALAVGWFISVQRDDWSANAAYAVALVIGFAVLTYCLTIAYGRRLRIVVTAVLGATALLALGVVGMTFWDGAVDAFGWVLVAGGVTVIVGGGLWFASLPDGVESAGRLRHMQRLTDELWPLPGRQEPADAPQPSGDRRTLASLLDQLDEEIDDSERIYRRATRRWQSAHIVLASLASVTAGAAGVVVQTNGDPKFWATILAALAAALSGLAAALNPGKRQEDNRLTALGAQALRREIRVLREHDIHHDEKVRPRVRDALEDLTVRFETIQGRPAEPTFWRRNHPEQQPDPSRR
jgi:hypothetical protein